MELVNLDKSGGFAWETTWGRILTLDQLKMRGLPSGNKSYICRREEQNVDHIFLHLVTLQEYCGSWSSLCLA